MQGHARAMRAYYRWFVATLPNGYEAMKAEIHDEALRGKHTMHLSATGKAEAHGFVFGFIAGYRAAQRARAPASARKSQKGNKKT